MLGACAKKLGWQQIIVEFGKVEAAADATWIPERVSRVNKNMDPMRLDR